MSSQYSRNLSVMKIVLKAAVLKRNKAAFTTGNSSEEEINASTTLIDDAASKVWEQYDDILQALFMEK